MVWLKNKKRKDRYEQGHYMNVQQFYYKHDIINKYSRFFKGAFS